MKKVLVIEDDPVMLRGLKDNFEFEGYTVKTAADGDAGLKEALRVQPDLIILDLMLPKINGYEICRFLREEKQRRSQNPQGEAARDRESRDQTENHRGQKIERAPERSSHPKAGRARGQREQESDLETPKQVLPLQRSKEQRVPGKQEPVAPGGVAPARHLRQPPDIERGDADEQPVDE